MKKSLMLAVIILVNFVPLTNAQWSIVGSAGFSVDTAYYTSIAIDKGGTPFVVYEDRGNSNKATVMKYNGTSWVPVGSAGFSAGSVSYTSIAIDGNGTPFVVYEDRGNSNKATVMKYNGTSWVTVGSAGFSAGNVEYTSIAIDGNGTPFVVYEDGGNSNKATVMKYSGTSWVTVGLAGFSGYAAYYTSIAIDRSGTPFVAFTDGAIPYKATVMKYNGEHWLTVGSADFSADAVIYTSIALNGSGTPFVAFVDAGIESFLSATVMKYNGTSWVTVGSAGFSASTAYYTSIAINRSGYPYVVYRDGGYSNRATVMEYNGTGWVTIGSAGFSAGSVGYTSIAIDGNGIPYVVYEDGGNSAKATVMKYKFSIPIAVQYEIYNVQLLPLNQGIKNSLISKLNNVLSKYNRGNYKAAVNQLNALINELRSFTAKKNLTSLEVQPLIDLAHQIIDALSSSINSSLYKIDGNQHTWLPEKYGLSQNYPNPFNPSTKINYQIPVSGHVTLKVYDELGREVRTLVNDNMAAGSYNVEFNGSELASGIYYYRITAGKFTDVKKLILLK